MDGYLLSIFFLMIRRPPRSTRTDTLFPYTTLVRSIRGVLAQGYGLLAVNGQFFIFEIPAGNPLADDAGGEQQQQDDGQSVILEEVRHLTRSEEHTSELQSLMRISYAIFCLKKKIQHNTQLNI